MQGPGGRGALTHLQLGKPPSSFSLALQPQGAWGWRQENLDRDGESPTLGLHTEGETKAQRRPLGSLCPSLTSVIPSVQWGWGGDKYKVPAAPRNRQPQQSSGKGLRRGPPAAGAWHTWALEQGNTSVRRGMGAQDGQLEGLPMGVKERQEVVAGHLGTPL